MVTWNKFNQTTTTVQPGSAWEAFNIGAEKAMLKKEAASQTGIDVDLFRQLREGGEFSTDIRARLLPQKTSFEEMKKSGVRGVVKGLGKEFIEGGKTVGKVGKDLGKEFLKAPVQLLDQMVRNIRGLSQLVATPMAGLIASVPGGATPKEAMSESLRMTKEVMITKEVGIDDGMEQGAQQYLKIRKIGKYGDNEPNVLDVAALTALGFFNLFGDPAFELGFGIKGMKILKEFTKFKKVGKIVRPLPKEAVVLSKVPTEIKITPDLKIKIKPKEGHLVIEGFKKRFPKQKALPDGQLADDVTDLVMDSRQLTNTEMTAKFVGDDLILTPTEAIKPVAKKIAQPVTETVTKPLEPIGTGEIKTSKLAAGVEAKALENKLIDTIGDLPEYRTVSMSEQAKLAVDFLKSNPDSALNVAKGIEVPPPNILPESIFVAVEDAAIKTGNVGVIQELSKSQLSTEATAMGQRIRTLGERKSDSPVNIIRDIIKAREEKVVRKSGAKSITEVKNKTIKNIKSNIKKPKRGDWEAFIRSIEC